MFDDVILSRFWRNVEKRCDDECWLWQGSFNPKGYGRIFLNGKYRIASRISLQIKEGRILEKDELACHTCDNPPCVNPNHLWVGSPSDNAIDSAQKKRHHKQRVTHCPKGHEYTEQNTVIERNGRSCRECKREKDKLAHIRKMQNKPEKKTRTHCKYGHELTPDNISVQQKKGENPYVICKTCSRERYNRYTRKQRIISNG